MTDMNQNPLSLSECIDQLNQALQQINTKLVDRETLVQLIILAAIAREHLLVLGPPGTAKSAAVRAIAGAFDGKYFEYVLGRFSEPNELFGPIDLGKLKEGVVETETKGMLPEADIAFLDEVFLGSTAILNTLLGILNERQFNRGHTRMNCPLRVCVSASNTLPDDPALSAFADRFLLRLHVEALPDSMLETLLNTGWRSATDTQQTIKLPITILDTLSEAARDVNLQPTQEGLAYCIRQLRKAGIELSDRRIVKTQSLIAAAAILDGRLEASNKDLWPIIYAIPTPEAQQQAREVLQDILLESANPVLPQAVSQAASGPLARAGTIIPAARLLLSELSNGVESSSAMLLRVESFLREIDAGFAGYELPQELKDIRQQLVRIMEHTPIMVDGANDSELATS